MKTKHAALLMAMAALGPLPLFASTETWITGTTANWSATTAWSGGAIPVTGDDVAIGDAGAGGETVTFDVTGGLSLKSLSLTQSTAGGTNILTFSLPSSGTLLTVTNGITLSATSGKAEIAINGSGTNTGTALATGTSGLTLNSGGLLLIQPLGNSFTAVTGNVTVNGGAIITGNNGTSAQGVITIGATSGNLPSGDSFTMSSGAIEIFENSGSNYATLAFESNVNITGGAIDFASTTTTGTYGTLSLRGLTNTIGSGVTIQSFKSAILGNSLTGGSTYAAPITLQVSNGTQTSVSTETQTLSYGTNLGVITMKELDTTKTNTYIHQLSTPNSATIQGVTLQTSGATDEFQLGSNITFAGGGSTIRATRSGGTGTASYIVDLNGYTLDMTANAAGWAPTAANTASTTTNWAVSSSTGTGTFKAYQFNFAMSPTSGTNGTFAVNSGVILTSTGTSATNVLSVASGGASSYTFDPNSTFYYAPTSTGSGTISSSATLGKIRVGSGTVTTTLTLGSNIAAAGSVTTNSNATLDLYGYGLTLYGVANLTGAGTVFDSSTTASTVSFYTSATGGLAPGGGVSGNTTATLTLGSNVGVTLNSGSTSIFNIASAASNDKISGGTLTLGGTLVINFLNGYSPTLNQTFTLFSASTLSGGFSSITFEDNGVVDANDAGTLSAGVLTITAVAVPEPSVVFLLLVGFVALFHIRHRNRLERIRA